MRHKLYKWLWQLSSGFRIRIVSIIALSFIGIVFSIIFADLSKLIIDKAISGQYFLPLLFIIISTKLVQLFIEQYEIYLRICTKAKITAFIEMYTFKSLFTSSIKERQLYHSGDEISRLNNDVESVGEALSNSFPLMVFGLLQLICTWTYLMFLQPALTVILGLIAPLALLLGYYYTKQLLPIARKVRKDGSKLNVFMQEHLQRHELLSVMGRSENIVNKAGHIQKQFVAALLRKIRITIIGDSFAETGFAVSYLCVFVWGVFSIRNNTMNYGEFVVFLQLVGQLQRPVYMIKDQYPSLVASVASAERIHEISSLPKENIQEKHISSSKPLGLEICNIDFKYTPDSKFIYKGFSHVFKSGTTTVVFGETGSGKTTLIKLLLDIYQPLNGKIFLTNRDERISVTSSTRQNFIFVPQGNNLLSGTIRYNLELGNPQATEEEMREALFLSAAEFIYNELPDGLDTQIGENGLGLSEGQSQRIGIARGILQPGSILILDEPSSALDQETERILFTRLCVVFSKKTTIIITHKRSLAKYANNIIDLSNNKQ